MWTTLSDCGKQLTIHSKVREKAGEKSKEYFIIEVEFDQYKLELISVDDLPVAEKLRQILTCAQLVHYNFEIEESGS